jgi:hypothetical protein
LYLAWTRDPPPEAKRDSLSTVSDKDDDDDDNYNENDDPSDRDYDNRTAGRRPRRIKKRTRQITPTPRAGSRRSVVDRRPNQKLAKAILADRIRKWTQTSQRAMRPRVLRC